MPTMKTIPEVRKELLKVASTLRLNDGYTDLYTEANKIVNLVRSMYRRKAVRRAPIEHVTLTPSLAAKIKKYAKRHQKQSYATIGNKFNVSIGRVSEALVGKRVA